MIFGILLMTKPEGMGGMVVVGNAQSESAKTWSLLTVVPHSHRQFLDRKSVGQLAATNTEQLYKETPHAS